MRSKSSFEDLYIRPPGYEARHTPPRSPFRRRVRRRPHRALRRKLVHHASRTSRRESDDSAFRAHPRCDQCDQDSPASDGLYRRLDGRLRRRQLVRVHLRHRCRWRWNQSKYLHGQPPSPQRRLPRRRTRFVAGLTLPVRTGVACRSVGRGRFRLRPEPPPGERPYHDQAEVVFRGFPVRAPKLRLAAPAGHAYHPVCPLYGGELGSTEVMTSGLHAEVLCFLVNPSTDAV